MAQQTGPEGVTPAEWIGLSVREAQAHPVPRDAGSWASKVDRLEAPDRDGVRGTNVAGRRLTGPVQGFGKMWQKPYRMNAGTVCSPQAAIATWKAHFPEFWPRGNRKEDLFWVQTLTALGERLGVAEPRVDTGSVCIDSRRQWRNARNIWHNAAVRSMLQTLAAPFRGGRRAQPAG